MRRPRAAVVGRGRRCKAEGFPIDPTGLTFLQFQRQRLVFLACFDGGEGKAFSLHVRHSLPDGKGTEGGVILIPAGLVAEIGIPLPPSAQHGNVHAVFLHPVQGQRHQLFHMAFAPGLRMDADSAHIAGLERILAHMHAAGQRSDHAANTMLVHRQQMMPGAVPVFGVFLGNQSLKVDCFVLSRKNHAAESRQFCLFLRLGDAIFRHKRSSLKKGSFFIRRYISTLQHSLSKSNDDFELFYRKNNPCIIRSKVLYYFSLCVIEGENLCVAACLPQKKTLFFRIR